MIPMKKRIRTVTGEESLFIWDASCILNSLTAPVKGCAQSEFHGCCNLDQILSHIPVALSSPTATVSSSRTLSLTSKIASQSPKLSLVQFPFRSSKLTPL
jgi:hypothetical protein